MGDNGHQDHDKRQKVEGRNQEEKVESSLHSECVDQPHDGSHHQKENSQEIDDSQILRLDLVLKFFHERTICGAIIGLWLLIKLLLLRSLTLKLIRW